MSLKSLEYSSQHEAEAQVERMSKNGLGLGDKEVAAFGLSAYDKATVFLMFFEPPIPNRGLFEDYFRQITKDAHIPPEKDREVYVEKERRKEASKEAWEWSQQYVILPEETLPEGWRLMIKPELPPDPDFPWLKKNPMVIERDVIEELGKRGYYCSVSFR